MADLWLIFTAAWGVIALVGAAYLITLLVEALG